MGSGGGARFQFGTIRGFGGCAIGEELVHGEFAELLEVLVNGGKLERAGEIQVVKAHDEDVVRSAKSVVVKQPQEGGRDCVGHTENADSAFCSEGFRQREEFDLSVFRVMGPGHDFIPMERLIQPRFQILFVLFKLDVSGAQPERVVDTDWRFDG